MDPWLHYYLDKRHYLAGRRSTKGDGIAHLLLDYQEMDSSLVFCSNTSNNSFAGPP